MDAVIVPSLFIKSKGEQTTKLTLRLTTAPRKVVVRLTGGCGCMSSADAQGMEALFTEAFSGFDGALLFGGTRMLARTDQEHIVPGVTEVAALIRRTNPHCVSLGVVPRTQDLRISDAGMVVQDDPRDEYVTIIHPHQDMCLVVQTNVDDPAIWDAEFLECARIIDDLRTYASFQHLLICYNGGGTTERELLHHVQRGWPVLLVAGSGRITDRYANDETFLAKHPSVQVCQMDAAQIRHQLVISGMLPPDKLRLVTVRRA